MRLNVWSMALVGCLVLAACKKTSIETARAPAATTLDLEVWPEAGQEARISRVNPHLTVGELSLALTPRIPAVAWSAPTFETSPTLTRVRLEGKRGDKPVVVTWTFAQGNPQARLDWQIQVDRAETEDVTLGLDLPVGAVQYVNVQQRLASLEAEEITLPASAPRWVTWSGAQPNLSVSGWHADGLSLSSDANVRLDFVVYAPQKYAEIACQSGPSVEVRGDALVTVGAQTPVFPSRFANMRQSAIVPVFADLGGRFGADGQSQSANDYASRIRTLALGHSATDDPRHGNGGLIGTNLGGTFLVESQAKTAAMNDLVAALDGTTVSLAVTDEDPVAFARCQTPTGVRHALKIGEAWAGNYRNEAAALPPSGTAGVTSWELPILDGSREVITDQIFTRPYMDQTLRERAVVAFITPLVATRNPLVDAYQNTLLTPERQGAWTISEEVERVFADLELTQDTAEHAVLSASALLDDMQNAFDARIERRSDGSWRVLGQAAGFTAIVEGAPEVTVDGAEAVSDAIDPGQTWVAFDLKGQAILRVADEPPLVGVRWTVDPAK